MRLRKKNRVEINWKPTRISLRPRELRLRLENLGNLNAHSSRVFLHSLLF